MTIILIVLLVLAILSVGGGVWAGPGYAGPGSIVGVVLIVILVWLLVGWR